MQVQSNLNPATGLFQSRDYYDGTKNSIDFEYQNIKQEVGAIQNKAMEEGDNDPRIAALVAEMTGLGFKINVTG